MGWGSLEREDLGSWLQDQQHFQYLGVWVGSGEQYELRHVRRELWVASQGAVRCQWLDLGSGHRELMSGSWQRGNKRWSLGIGEGPPCPTCTTGIAEGPPRPMCSTGIAEGPPHPPCSTGIAEGPPHPTCSTRIAEGPPCPTCSLGIAEGPLHPTCSMGIAEGPLCPTCSLGIAKGPLCPTCSTTIAEGPPRPRAPRGLLRVLPRPTCSTQWRAWSLMNVGGMWQKLGSRVTGGVCVWEEGSSPGMRPSGAPWW